MTRSEEVVETAPKGLLQGKRILGRHGGEQARLQLRVDQIQSEGQGERLSKVGESSGKGGHNTPTVGLEPTTTRLRALRSAD